MRRWLTNRAFLIAVGLVALVLFLALRPRPVDVELATATRKPMRVTVDEEGRTRIREKFLVTAPVGGIVSRIELDPGDRVTRGQAIATIQPGRPPLLDARTRAELHARVDAARAALDRARAEAQRAVTARTHAQSEARRLRPLHTAGAVSDSELETYETQVRAAEDGHRAAAHAVEFAAAELQAARATLSDADADRAPLARVVTLRAPVDGAILRRLRESESVVPAGEALVEIGDPHRLEIVADFLSTDAVAIPAGTPVIVDQWGGGRSLQGRVRRVEPAGFTKVSALGVEEQRVNVIIDFLDPVEAWKALGDGYRVEARAVLWEQTNVLTVPVGALFREGESWATYVVREGHAELRTVTIGHRTDREAEVTAGLREGEQVVVHPSDALRAGIRVALRET
jgi:HlyD family secretion protein